MEFWISGMSRLHQADDDDDDDDSFALHQRGTLLSCGKPKNAKTTDLFGPFGVSCFLPIFKDTPALKAPEERETDFLNYLRRVSLRR